MKKIFENFIFFFLNDFPQSLYLYIRNYINRAYIVAK